MYFPIGFGRIDGAKRSQQKNVWHSCIPSVFGKYIFNRGYNRKKPTAKRFLKVQHFNRLPLGTLVKIVSCDVSIRIQAKPASDATAVILHRLYTRIEYEKGFIFGVPLPPFPSNVFR